MAYPAKDGRPLRAFLNGDVEKGGLAPSAPSPEVATRRETNRTKLILIICFQLGMSVSMSLVNKAAIGHLPYPVWLVVFQTAATVLILQTAKAFGLIDYKSFSWHKGGKQFVGVSILFVMPILFSMIAMKYISVQTLVVFRQLTTALTVAGEISFYRRAFSALAYLSVLVGLLGSLLYASSASDYNFVGYAWSTLFAVSMAANALYNKRVYDKFPDMSTFEKAYYQNLLALPFLLLWALPMESLGACLGHLGSSVSLGGWLAILFSFVAGFAICVAGVLTRDAVSPTAFNIVGNSSKPMTVLLSFVFFGAETSTNALLGLAAVLVAGVMYSYGK